MATMTKIRVLIADDDGQLSRRLADFIGQHGFDVRISANGNDAKKQIVEWKPRLVLADMMLPESNAIGILDMMNSEPRLRHQLTHVLVMSGHNSPANVKQALSRGAKDYLVKPFRVEDVLRRLVFHCRNYRQLQDLSRSEYGAVDEGSLLLHLTDLVLRQAITGDSIPNILFNLTKMVAMKVDGVRCSVIHAMDAVTGVVVVSSDNRSASGIQLDLNKYPEVTNVVNTGVMIAIENIDKTPELKLIKGLLREIMFNSMIVCPVSRYQKPFGVLSLRMPPERTSISDNEMRFVEIVSHVVSLVLSNENFKDIDNFYKIDERPSKVVSIARRGKK
jgi:DNA-binding response OmpR family regulator